MGDVSMFFLVIRQPDQKDAYSSMHKITTITHIVRQKRYLSKFQRLES